MVSEMSLDSLTWACLPLSPLLHFSIFCKGLAIVFFTACFSMSIQGMHTNWGPASEMRIFHRLPLPQKVCFFLSSFFNEGSRQPMPACCLPSGQLFLPPEWSCFYFLLLSRTGGGGVFPQHGNTGKSVRREVEGSSFPGEVACLNRGSLHAQPATLLPVGIAAAAAAAFSLSLLAHTHFSLLGQCLKRRRLRVDPVSLQQQHKAKVSSPPGSGEKKGALPCTAIELPACHHCFSACRLGNFSLHSLLLRLPRLFLEIGSAAASLLLHLPGPN